MVITVTVVLALSAIGSGWLLNGYVSRVESGFETVDAVHVNVNEASLATEEAMVPMGIHTSRRLDQVAIYSLPADSVDLRIFVDAEGKTHLHSGRTTLSQLKAQLAAAVRDNPAVAILLAAHPKCAFAHV